LCDMQALIAAGLPTVLRRTDHHHQVSLRLRRHELSGSRFPCDRRVKLARLATRAGWWDENPEIWRKIRSQEQFEDLISSSPSVVVVDCYTQNCGGCKLIQPALTRLAAEDAFSDIIFAKVDTDDMRAFASAHGVRTLPYVLVFRRGHGKLVGMQLSPFKLKLLRPALQTIMEHSECSEFRLDPNGFVVPVKAVSA